MNNFLLTICLVVVIGILYIFVDKDDDTNSNGGSANYYDSEFLC